MVWEKAGLASLNLVGEWVVALNSALDQIMISRNFENRQNKEVDDYIQYIS